MKQINRAIIFAGVSHLSTVVIGIVWILLLTTNKKIDSDSPVTINIEDSMLIILFPWIVTGVALLSTVMANPTRAPLDQNTQSTVIWRWRSYSWGAAVIMMIFIVLSFEWTGWIYLPTSSVAATATIQSLKSNHEKTPDSTSSNPPHHLAGVWWQSRGHRACQNCCKWRERRKNKRYHCPHKQTS